MHDFGIARALTEMIFRFWNFTGSGIPAKVPPDYHVLLDSTVLLGKAPRRPGMPCIRTCSANNSPKQKIIKFCDNYLEL